MNAETETEVTVEEVAEEFGYEVGVAPCPIRETDDGEIRYFVGKDYGARERRKEEIEEAGYTWRHPEDGRFHGGEDYRAFIITGRKN